MVRIGIIGIGFMGKTHYEAAKSVQGGSVTAICTRDPKKLAGDWTGIQGNFGGSGGVEDLSRVKRYTDIAEMLADPDIDLVDICLPTALHKDVAIQAFDAGKHVLLEKPIAVRLDDADAMVAASKRANRKFLVGQVLRFWPEFAYIKQLMDSGEHGALVAANFKRIIAEPTWGDNWFANLETSGGPGIDLHIHDSDFVNYLFGMPDKVFARGVLAGERHAQYLATNYIYDAKKVTISAQSGAISMKGRPFEHGYDVYFEKATVQYNSTWGAPLCVVLANGVTEPTLLSSDAFAGEIQYAVDAVTNDTEPTRLSGESARDSLALCWKEVESIRTGAVVSTR